MHRALPTLDKDFATRHFKAVASCSGDNKDLFKRFSSPSILLSFSQSSLLFFPVLIIELTLWEECLSSQAGSVGVSCSSGVDSPAH